MVQQAWQRYFAHRRYQGNLVASEGWLYFICDLNGRYNAWKLPCDGGWPRQLTDFSDQAARLVVKGPSTAPPNRRLLVLADPSGSEAFGLHAVLGELGGTEPLWTCAGRRILLSPESVSPDGRWILASANDRTPSDFDLVVLALADGQPVRRLTEAGYWQPALWAREGRAAVGAVAYSNAHNDLYWFSLEGAPTRHLTPHEGEAIFNPLQWLPDGRRLLLLSNRGREFIGLGVLDVEDPQAWQWVVQVEGDLEWASYDPLRRRLTWIVNQAGASRLWTAEWDGERLGEARPAAGWPLGVVTAVDAEGEQLFAVISRPTHPPEIWRYDLANQTGGPLTEGRFGGIGESAMSSPRLIHWQSNDGLAFSGWDYPPPTEASPGSPGRAPAVLVIHGGPEAQERPWYSGFYQYLVHRGIRVVAPNVRGSTGFGRRFQKLIYHDWGGREVEDLMAVVDWLARQPGVDPQRIAVFGASYGGYASLLLAGRFPDRFAAAVDLMGPTDLVTFVQRVPPSWRRFMAALIGDPGTEAEFLRSRSPIAYVDAICCPLLVIAGGQDPRVPPEESEQLVERLRAAGKPVEYHRFEDEGHGFVRRENQMQAWLLVADFLERVLKPGE